MPEGLGRMRWFLLAACAAAAADLATKALAERALDPFVPIQVLPFFDVRLGYNRGISFGLFPADSDGGVLLLAALTLGILGLVTALAWRARAGVERVGYGLILGGGLGNVVDRLGDGAVTDFLDAHLAGHHFPTFNMADVAITFGVAALFWATLLEAPVTAGGQADDPRRSTP